MAFRRAGMTSCCDCTSSRRGVWWRRSVRRLCRSRSTEATLPPGRRRSARSTSPAASGRGSARTCRHTRSSMRPAASGRFMNCRGGTSCCTCGRAGVAPCLAHMPEIQNAVAEWKGRSMTVVGLNVDEDQSQAQVARQPEGVGLVADVSWRRVGHGATAGDQHGADVLPDRSGRQPGSFVERVERDSGVAGRGK